MDQISTSPTNFCMPQTPSSLFLSPSILSFRSFHRRRSWSFHGRLFCALEAGPNSARVGSQEALDPDFLRKPIISPLVSAGKELEKEVEVVTVAKGTGGGRKYENGGEREICLDWEDQILEDTVPLVGFVRMILHSRKYGSGDRLSPEHEKTILERLLPYHPEFEKKIGCGVDHITIGYHPQFEDSRCLFIVRKDGELVDFSYWKCVKGLVRKKYPLYADSFILRHFRRRRRYD